jgi:2-isopropylmalate synthase
MAHALVELGVDVIEAGFPASVADDFAPSRPSPSEVRGSHRRTRALPAPRHRAWPPRAGKGRAPAHPRLHRDQRRSTSRTSCGWPQAEASGRRRPPRRAGAPPLRRRRVLGRGRLADRTGLPRRDVQRRGRRRRRTSTCPTPSATRCPRVRRAVRLPAQACARHRQRACCRVHCHDDLGMAVANSLAAVVERRAPGRVHDQRHRRARRQLRARGIVMALKTREAFFTTASHAHPHQRLYPTSRLVSNDHRQRGAAQQGDRRRERLRPRIRHPPARHAAPPRDLRDHAPEDVGVSRSQPRARQAQRPPRLPRPREELGFELPEAALNRPSRSSSRSPTRRRNSSTATSRRSSLKAEGRHDEGPWTLVLFEVASHSAIGRATASVTCGWAIATAARSAATAVGDGPVDAACQAIEPRPRVAPHHAVRGARAVGGRGRAGRDRRRRRRTTAASYRGRSVSTDIVEASAQALLEVINRIARREAMQARRVKSETNRRNAERNLRRSARSVYRFPPD